ncbi:MAG: OmpA family protein [Pseudomonadota bacterium]
MKFSTTFLIFLASAQVSYSCENRDAVIAAVSAKDLAASEAFHPEGVADCDEAFKNYLKDYLARSYEVIGMDTSLAPADRHEALTKSYEYGPDWAKVANRGFLYWEEKDYLNASKAFEVALQSIDKGDKDAKGAEITKVHRHYTAAVALAEAASPSDVTFQTTFRGFKVEEVPSQITFVFAKTEFDEKGEIFAQALLDFLLEQSPDRVELDGHTDPIGGEEFNMDLSIARGEAVKTFLEKGGFEGEIVVRGFGETQVPTPLLGQDEGSEEHYQLARRVVMRME